MLEGLEGMSIRDVSWCPEIVLLCFEGRFRNVIVCMISSRIFLFLEALLVAVGVRPAIFLGGFFGAPGLAVQFKPRRGTKWSIRRLRLL